MIMPTSVDTTRLCKSTSEGQLLPGAPTQPNGNTAHRPSLWKPSPPSFNYADADVAGFNRAVQKRCNM